MRKNPGPIEFAAVLLSLLSTPALLANGYPTLHWLGANGTSWTAGNNWSSNAAGTAPVDFSPNAYTIFSATGSANSSATNLGGDQTVSSLTIAVNGPVGLGGGTLTVNGPVQIQTGSLTIGGGGGLVVAGSTPVPQTINALFAANNGANTVSVYNLDNSNLFVATLGAGVLTAPTVLSADADGNLHVLNGTPGSTPKVSVFAPDGTLLREVNSPGFPTTATPGFAVGPNGTLQLSDTAADTVSIFDSVGNLIRQIATGLDSPIGLATGLGGKLYVANTASSSISIFDPDGTPFGNATASFPSVLAASSNGTIYAPGGGIEDQIIELFFPDGLPAGNITVSNSRNIKGLAVTPDGSFYASYEGSPAIHAFAPDGTPTGQITENLLSPYGLWTGNFTTETLQFNGITLAASSSDTATLNIGTFGGNDTTVSVAAHSIQFGAGTATLNLNLNGDFTLTAPLTGGGLQSTINKFGTGTTTLASADSTYAGAIHIHAGTLAITGSVANSSTGIHAGGTLAGDGILGSVEVHTGGTIAPGASGGTSTLTMGNTVWNGGGIFELQFASVNGTAGSDWDFLSSTGSLTVNATSGDQFVIDATAQEGSGFDPAAESYKWQIANFSGNITGFAPDKFQILASGFNGSTGTFSVSANSTSLALNYRTLFAWTAGNGSWSGEANWLDNARPVEGGPIQFSGPGGTSTNDFLASIASLAFTANATGSYTLGGGNLTLGSGGITNNSQHSQTIALNLSLSEDQTFAANSANLVVIGNITGTAPLTKTGNQSLVLSGINALSGNTTVFSGELAITGGSLATKELQIGNGGNGTLHLSGGTIEAAGSLIALFENSPGTATVTGGTWNNAGYLSVGEYGIGTLNLTGGTVSVGNGTGTLDLARQVGSVGTLNIGTGTTAGTLSVANITAGEGTATVNFHHSGNLVFAPALTGNLALHQLGTGTTTLIAENTHTGGTTITSGTLQIGTGGTTGSVSGEILNDSALAIHRSDDLTFTNTLNGTGSVIKLGNNTLTYNSTAPQGGTFVNAGTLLVTGTTSSVTVNSTGILAGAGTVGDVFINSGGAIAPGSSPGTITVANLTLESGAIYNWQTSSINGTAGTDWDFIASPGTLTLNATSGSRITINVSSLGNATLAGVKNASWQIGNFTTGIVGFDATAFTFDSSGMTGAIGRFSLSQNSSALLLNYKSGVVWNTGSGNWSTTAQWEDNAPPVNGDAIEFSGPGGTSTNNGYLTSVSGIAFTSAAGAYTLNGTDVTIGQVGLVNDSNDSQTISINLVLGTNQTFAANAANLIVSGNLSGNASLTKAGNQTLTLSGSNTYTGATTINTGTLAIAAGGSLNGTAKILVGNTTSGNTLAISQGGSVEVTGDATLGNGTASSNNTVLVSGNSSLVIGGYLDVGDGGSFNALTISQGGSVEATRDATLGYLFTSSNNTVLVSGNSSLFIGGYLYVGDEGSFNALTISQGGSVEVSNSAILGDGTASSNNTVLVSGNSSLIIKDDLFVGGDGSSNALTISQGGSVKVSDSAILGDGTASSNNTVLVSGNSSLVIGGYLDVGDEGSFNALTISQGGSVEVTGDATLGYLSTSSNNTVLVNGANSSWTNRGLLAIGYQGGNNTLTVANNGTVSSFGGISIAFQAGSGGTLNIGTFGANGAGGMVHAPSIAFGDGIGTVNFNQSDSVTLSANITGGGAVNQLGNGTTALTANNIYTGGTTISAGTLQIGNGGTSGSVTGDITNNSALVFNRSNDSTYSGNITGTGSLEKLGAGVLTLANSTNTVGTTNITAGGLTLSNSSLTANGAVNANSGTITIGQGGTLATGNTTALQTFKALLATSRSGNYLAALNLEDSNSFVTTFGDGNVIAGAGIAFGTTGHIYVANYYGDSISIFAPDGTYTGNITGNLKNPNGLAFDSAGNLYVANYGSNSTSIFAPNGTYTGNITANLSRPTDVVFGTDGKLYISNDGSNSISVFAPNGTYTGSITGNLNRPYSMALGSNGSLYVVNNNNSSVSIFSLAGNLTGNITSNLSNPFGSVVDSDGKLYVANHSNSNMSISTFEPNGAYSGNIALDFVPYGLAIGNFSAQVSIPSGITLAASASDNATLNIGTFGGSDTTATVNAPAIVFGSGTAALNLNLAGNFTLSANLTGGNSNSSLNQLGSGTTTLTGNNAYTGSTTINDGGLLISGSVNGTSSVAVNGGSTLTVTGALTVNGNTIISSGNFTVGSGASFTQPIPSDPLWLSYYLFIGDGDGSSAHLNIDGGSLSGFRALIGNSTNSTGSATMNGGTWANSNSLEVGSRGNGTLLINSGNISNSEAFIANYAGSTGLVTMNNGTWTISSALNVGEYGHGTLLFNDGAISASSLRIGDNAGSIGVLTMHNGTLSSLYSLNIGSSGNGTLNLAGGTLTGDTAWIGDQNNSTGVVNVSGGTLSTAGSLFRLGQRGNGTLNLTGGTVSIQSGTGSLTMAWDATSTGILNIGNGTTAGELQAAKVALATGGSGGTAIVNFNHTGNHTFAPVLEGALTVNKLGNGTTTLTANSSALTGNVSINAGTLAVTGVLANATTQVNSGGTLAGNGTLGAVTINSGGTIALGTSPGTITTGNMTWNGGGTYAWELGNATGTAGTGWDLIRSTTGNLTINATSGSKFIIAASTNSSASGFNPNAKSYSWKIAEFLNISGFATDAFDIQTSGFDNLPTIRVFSVSSNSTALSLNYATAATWIGGSGNWTDTSMWQGGFVPINGLAVDYAGTNGTSTNDSSLANIGGLAFDSEAGAYTLAGGNLSIGAGGIVNNSTFTQTVGINLALGADQTFAANTANLVISGDISGGYALTKEGNQTLVLSGSNTYTGETTINAGTLAIAQGGSLTGTSKIFVGNTTSSNTLNILGSVGTGNLTLSHQAGSNDNIVTVGGGSSPASLTVDDLINVGFGGTGNTLDILGNGTVTAASTWIGGYGSNNTANVNGGVLNSTSDVVVGYFQDGNNLNITSGGNVTAGSLILGLDPGSSGNALLVSGTGSVFSTSGLVYLGQNGTSNSITVALGGKFLSGNPDAVLGLGTISTGNSLSIDGTGSQFTNNGTFYVGRAGSNNTLSMDNGGSLTTRNGRIGHDSTSSNNTATVSGNGSKWTNTGTLRVGSDGSNNSLAVTSGANVTVAGNTFIGHGAASANNLVRVQGAGSVLNLANANVGLSGSNNTLLVADSGTINAVGIQLSGTNSTLQIGNGAAGGTITTTLGIGTGSGTGHQVVFNHTDSNLAFSPILTGNLSVSQIGNGTTALTANNIYSGSTTISAGTLSIGNGGTSGSVTGDITNNSALVFNRSNDSTYSGNITGTGSLEKLGAGVLTLANSTNTVGTTTITAGGLTLSISSLTTNGGVNINTGTLTIAEGGILNADPIANSNGITLATSASDNATLNIGTFGGSDTTVTLGTKFIQFGTGTGILNLNRAADEIFLTEFLGGGANSTINQLGTGTTTIASFNNTFAGTANIKAGTLEVSGALANATVVAQGGTLAGSGTVGDTIILATGTINPNGGTPVGRVSNGSGSYIGTLTVGNLTLNGGAIYNWQTTSNGTFGTAGTDWDLISSLGALTLNATSGNPITISLSTIGGTTLAGVKKASWEIGNFTTGITGFEKSAFSFNSTSMAGNDGRYFMTLGGGNTTLVLNYNTAATWNSGTGNWTTAAQWEDESLPANGDEVEFIGLGGTSTNNFASGNLSNISGFTFVEGAGAYTVNGNTLQIGEDGIVNSSTEHQTIGMNLTAGEVLVVDAFNGSIEISGVVSGASALSKTGPEALILTANNTYTGGTTISAGMLAIGGETGAVAGNIIVEAGATFAVERTNNATITNLISGSGSFAQLGTGVTSIIGNNTYAGGTSIIYGTLWAKSAGALGNGSTTVGQNFAQMSTLSIPSTSPALLVSSTQEMGGNLLVGGDLNWYDGTIAFYDTGTSPASGDLTINVGGNFSVSTSTGNATFDFSAVEALDAGVYTLINATSIQAGGTNFIAAHGQYTKLFGNFTTTANTVVYTVTGATSGGPNIQNNGGPNTPVVAVFDVTEATQTIGANNTVNALNFTNNASLSIQPGGQLTLTGGNLNVQTGNSVISGGTLNTTGNLTKLGAGELDLVSNTSVNGTATVQAGLLSVNGQLNANTVVIDTGGTMGGNGTINAPGGMRIAGTFAPGNSPGVISVVSNPVWESTSDTIIEIAGNSTFDRIAVTGQATLAGNMTVVQFNGFQLAYGQRYEILTATSGITGNFSAINMPGTFANSRGRFLINGTTGTLLIAPLSYVPLALNQNQRNVAAALDSFILANGGDRQTVSIALDSLTAAQYPAAFDAIMPGFYETLGDMVIEQAYNQTQLLNQRLSSVRLGASGFQAIGMSQPLKYDIDGDSVAEASTLDFVSAARGENGIWTPARIGRMAGSAPTAPAPYAPLGTNWNSWVMGIGEFAMSRGLSGVPNYNNNAGGFLAGADYRFGPTLSAGVYAGYQYNYAKYDNGSSTQGNSALFGLYASYANEGGYYADAVIGGGYTGFQTRRSIEFPGIDRTATADPGSGQFSAALNLGKDFQVGKFTLGPIVGAQYTYAGIGSFTESGADSLNLSLDQQNVNSLRTNLGARLAYNWEICKNTVLIPEVRGFWMHEFLNNPANITSSLNGGAGPSFDYETETPYRDSIFGGVGVSAKLGERWSASAFYNVNFGAAGYTNNIISTTLGFSF